MRTKFFYGAGIIILLALLIIMPESCYRKFYKVADNSRATNIDSTIRSQSYKYLILRSGDRAFHMQNIAMSSDNKSLTCQLVMVDTLHTLYLSADKKKGIPYMTSKRQGVVMNEVHIYIPSDNTLQYDSLYTLDLNKISKIEILEKDKERTTTSTIVSTVEIVLSVAAFIGIVGAIAIGNAESTTTTTTNNYNGSCPFISAYKGNEFITQGELYAGSVYPQLARNDYLPLIMQPVSNGKLQIKISNDQQEVQNTDLAELMVVTHDKDVQMMVDENGKLYSVSKPFAPVSATVNDKDILDVVAKQEDDLVYSYDDTSAKTHNIPVQLTFNKEHSRRKAKLILNIRNASWIDYVFNKMTEGYGTYYSQFVKRQHNRPASELHNWIQSQNMPLTVSVLTIKGWQKIADLSSVGPIAFRQTIVPIDLANIPGNSIRIQLSSGFMFWELSYAAIDFTDDENYTVEKLLPVKAVDENGKDVTSLLTGADEQYLIQPVPGNLTTIDYEYKNQLAEGKAQTYVLHSKGYYEYVRDYKNEPDVKFLKQFKNKGALSNYSMALYKQVVNGDFSSFAKK